MRIIWSDCGRQGTEYPAKMCVPKITKDQHPQRWSKAFSLMRLAKSDGRSESEFCASEGVLGGGKSILGELILNFF
jgi:hypothetical protein